VSSVYWQLSFFLFLYDITIYYFFILMRRIDSIYNDKPLPFATVAYSNEMGNFYHYSQTSYK